MILRTPRRPGVTLIEVLVAIFILSIGMLAIMALFPIGAVSMARAINQTRSADHAANSDAVFRYYWKRAWVDQSGGGGLRPLRTGPPGTNAIEIEPMIANLDTSPLLPGVVMIPPSSAQPSFPVLVDPIGFQTQANNGLNFRNFVGGVPSLPSRSSLAAVEADPNLTRSRVRLTTLLDDMTFDGNGEAANLTGQLERGGRYNVAWLIQRPKNNVPQDVHLTVLVFAGRSPTDTPSTEQTFSGWADNYVANTDPKPNLLSISLANQPKPAVRKGSWVAFGIPCTPPNGVPFTAFDFYRISAVDDSSVPNQVNLELEEPLRTYDVSTMTSYTLATGTVSGIVVVFENLMEVFDRGIVSASAISGR